MLPCMWSFYLLNELLSITFCVGCDNCHRRCKGATGVLHLWLVTLRFQSTNVSFITALQLLISLAVIFPTTLTILLLSMVLI